jgi:MoaA/NifB/PqqE/SkfB family radical SAM enzyme
MSHSEWLKLIEEANELRCERFNFSGGEPLLYQNGDQDKLIELINACKAPVIILTNGHFLTPDVFKKLQNTKKLKAIRLSLDGLESHDLFRRSGDYKLVLDRIRMVKEQSTIPVAVVTMINNSNMDEILPLYQKLRILSIDWWNLDIPFCSTPYKQAPVEFCVPPYSKVVSLRAC